LCQPPGVYSAYSGLAAVLVPACHSVLSTVRPLVWCLDLSWLTVYPMSSHNVLDFILEFVVYSHFSTSDPSPCCSTQALQLPVPLIYLHINPPFAALNLSMHSPRCITLYLCILWVLYLSNFTFLYCALISDPHHYHKVLQHIEVLC